MRRHGRDAPSRLPVHGSRDAQELPGGRAEQVTRFVTQHEQRYGPLDGWAVVDDEPLVDPQLLAESMMLQVRGGSTALARRCVLATLHEPSISGVQPAPARH